MNINLADVTVHIDETLDASRLASIEEGLRGLDGVVSVSHLENRPHLKIVAYNPAKVDARAVLAHVTAHGVHAELIGL